MKLQPWRFVIFNIDMVRSCSDCSIAVMLGGDETVTIEDIFFNINMVRNCSEPSPV